jgi:hypothetical protein
MSYDIVIARPGPAEKDMVKTTVTIVPAVYTQLKKIAAEEQTNVRVIIRRALDKFLKGRRAGRRSK